MSVTISNDYILNHSLPHEAAKKFLDTLRVEGSPGLVYISTTSNFYAWNGSNWKLREGNTDIHKMIKDYLALCFEKSKDGESMLPFKITPSFIEQTFYCVRLNCDYGMKDPSIESNWLFYGEDENRPDPSKAIRFKNKIVFVDRLVEGHSIDRAVENNHSRFFSSHMIPLNIEPLDYGRLRPAKWLRFLDELFGDDRESILLLQQWFGYCLTLETDQQKMLYIVGPTRAGKGVITKTLQSLVGKGNYCCPTASQLGERFGLVELIHSRLCVVSDARFGKDRDRAKEVILSITGEDDVIVDRKNRDGIRTKLNTKIMICSNELPCFSDAGAALAARMMILRLSKSFQNMEDNNLFERELLPELPRIFLWALEGLLSLKEAKSFVKPQDSEDMKKFLRMQQSPVLTFVNNECVVKDDLEIPKTTLFNGYKRWCEENGVEELASAHFFRYLYSHNKKIGNKKGQLDYERVRVITGISLKDRQ